ncbi:RidA family protein [Jiulongibacter sp. NS-SX5]|uniref:RidA family protein n=1 Tax=Jiulongibacter sp. NS-SX5 TaxID=3463854 RepID=UPI004059575E
MKFNISYFKLFISFVSFIVFTNSLYAQEIVMKGNPASIISSTAQIPSNAEYFYTSGFTALAIKPELKDGEYEKYGDTKTQAISVLERLKSALEAEGYSFKDVFSMHVFVAPDTKSGEFDFKGWNEAYKQYFGTEETPNKPIRATVGVATLVNPHKFIEIEVIAAKSPR